MYINFPNICDITWHAVKSNESLETSDIFDIFANPSTLIVQYLIKFGNLGCNNIFIR